MLAVLTSLLILNGCDSKGPLEQASEQVVEEVKKQGGPLYEPAPAGSTPPAPTESAAPATGETPGEQAPEPPAP